MSEPIVKYYREGRKTVKIDEEEHETLKKLSSGVSIRKYLTFLIKYADHFNLEYQNYDHTSISIKKTVESIDKRLKERESAFISLLEQQSKDVTESFEKLDARDERVANLLLNEIKKTKETKDLPPVGWGHFFRSILKKK